MRKLKPFQFIKLSVLGFCIISQVASCNVKEKPLIVKDQTVNNRSGILVLDKSIKLTGLSGRIDHMAVDEKNQILFIAAIGNNSVEAVDLQKGKILNSIRDIDEPQGIVFVPENNTICFSSGGSGECYFYDANNFKLLNSIKLGSDADNMRYESGSKLIFAGYGEGGIAIIDALKQTLISSVSFAGHPEAFQPEKNGGRIYVNVPSSKSIDVIDLKSNSVVNTWHIDNAASNFPIALDDANNRLFVGCRKPSVIIVFDTQQSKEVTRFDIRGDVDDIFYEPEKKALFLSCGEGYVQVFEQADEDKYELLQETATSSGARTSLFVKDLKKLFVAVPQSGDSEAAIQVYRLSQ